MCSLAGDCSVQRLQLARGLDAELADADPQTAEEGLHQDAGERPQDPALRGRHGQ